MTKNTSPRVSTLKLYLVLSWSMAMLLIAILWNMAGVSANKALIASVTLMFLPALIFKTAKSAAASLILHRSLDALEYQMYRILKEDGGETVLASYPDHEKVSIAKEKIKRTFADHPWLRKA